MTTFFPTTGVAVDDAGRTASLGALPDLVVIPDSPCTDVDAAVDVTGGNNAIIDLTILEVDQTAADTTPVEVDTTVADTTLVESADALLAAASATVSDTAFDGASQGDARGHAAAGRVSVNLSRSEGATRFPRLLSSRAKVVLVACDVAGLLCPGLFVRHCRVELLAVTALSVLLFQGGGLYRPKLKLSALDDVPRLAVRSAAAMLLIGALMSMSAHPPYAAEFFALAGSAIALQLVFRCASYGLISRARAAGRVGHETLVIGSGEVAERIVSRLVTDKSYGLRLAGVLSSRPTESSRFMVPCFGPESDLRRTIRETDAQVLIVALGDEPEAELVRVLRSSERTGCEIFVVPRLFEIYNYGQTDHIGAVPVVRLPRRGHHHPSRVVKRVIDVLVSSVALVLCSPVLIAAAIAVRTEGPGSVIFRQVRVGRGGRHFELLKFRSLKPVDETESATLWNVSNDDRMGAVGKFLRRTSIDELPQLINIIKGEMTLVGPRPERPHFAQAFAEEIPEYQERHRVTVGLTGLAQVSGLRGDTSIVDRARYDNFYIDNWTLWLDIKIMFGTVREVVGARGK